jgi:starch synthase
MRILQVASEAFGLIKTGGLADAVSGLAAALQDAGDDVRLLLPAYPGCAERARARPRLQLGNPLGAGTTRLLEGELPGSRVTVWLVDCPELFDRPGGPYLDAHGADHPDNHLRFGLLCRVAAMLAIMGAAIGWEPDIVHAHDWQTGFVPTQLALWGGRRPGTLFTVHNLHFQGRYPPSILSEVGLPAHAYALDGVELWGSASFIKGGLYHADKITTVSPSYAKEIQGETGGEGLHGLLTSRDVDLHGIINGIDLETWDPARDPDLAAPFDAAHLAARVQNKLALQERLQLRIDPDAPLVGTVGRLAHQKGIDLLLGALPRLLVRGAQVAVVGAGEGALEYALEYAAEANPGRVAFLPGYHEPMSHLMVAGCDAFVVPSRFEPCGLTQLYALRYGAVPVVRATGGLKDTVLDVSHPDGVGFVFDAATHHDLGDALDRALDAFGDKAGWAALQRRGMARDHGWAGAAAAYRSLYAQVAPHAAPTHEPTPAVAIVGE